MIIILSLYILVSGILTAEWMRSEMPQTKVTMYCFQLLSAWIVLPIAFMYACYSTLKKKTPSNDQPMNRH